MIIDLNPGVFFSKYGGRYWYFSMNNMLIPWFGIISFLGGDIAGDFILFFFLGMHFSVDTLAPVNTDKILTSAQILSSTIITFGADGYDWLVKFGALGTFYVLIDSLGNMSFPEIGATNFSFASFFYHLMIFNPGLFLHYKNNPSPMFSFYLVLMNHYTLKS